MGKKPYTWLILLIKGEEDPCQLMPLGKIHHFLMVYKYSNSIEAIFLAWSDTVIRMRGHDCVSMVLGPHSRQQIEINL